MILKMMLAPDPDTGAPVPCAILAEMGGCWTLRPVHPEYLNPAAQKGDLALHQTWWIVRQDTTGLLPLDTTFDTAIAPDGPRCITEAKVLESEAAPNTPFKRVREALNSLVQISSRHRDDPARSPVESLIDWCRRGRVSALAAHMLSKGAQGGHRFALNGSNLFLCIEVWEAHGKTDLALSIEGGDTFTNPVFVKAAIDKLRSLRLAN